MSPQTKAKMDEIVAFARQGNMIYPSMWTPLRGVSRTVGPAIRAAKKLGLIEEAGVDGAGKPKYRAVTPSATHASTAVAQ